MGHAKGSPYPWMGCIGCLYRARSVLGANGTRAPESTARLQGKQMLMLENELSGCLLALAGWTTPGSIPRVGPWHQRAHSTGRSCNSPGPVSGPPRFREQAWSSFTCFPSAAGGVLSFFSRTWETPPILADGKKKIKGTFLGLERGFPPQGLARCSSATQLKACKAQGLGSTSDTPSVLCRPPSEGLEPANPQIKRALIGHPQGPSMRHHVMQMRGRLIATKVHAGSLGGFGDPGPGSRA